MPLDELLPWEPNPEYASHDCRRDDSGEVVLSLAPEGCDGSQCWAWVVMPATGLPSKHGVNYGSGLDKETARRQADAAAVAYGYTLDNRVSDAPAIALRVLNMPIGEAARIVQEAGITFRIGAENGRPRILNDDRRHRDRVTVEVMNGVVIAATPG